MHIEPASGDLFGGSIHLPRQLRGLQRDSQQARQGGGDLLTSPQQSTPGQFAVFTRPLLMGIDSFGNIGDALSGARNRCHDDRRPLLGSATCSITGERDHLPQLARGTGRPVSISLIDHKDITDFQDARLGRLDSIAHAWCK